MTVPAQCGESLTLLAPRAGATAFFRPNSIDKPMLWDIAATNTCAAAKCSAGGPGSRRSLSAPLPLGLVCIGAHRDVDKAVGACAGA
jgi:hypothetical protein